MNKAVKIGGVVVLCGAAFTLGYLQELYMPKTSTTKTSVDDTTKTESTKEEELDTNSALVQMLLNEVSDTETMAGSRNWEYADLTVGASEDFYAEKANEAIKMQLVGRLLNEEAASSLGIGECNSIESNIDNRTKACEAARTNSYLNKYNVAYTKKYVERLYKQLFGSDAELNTSVDINLDFLRQVVLHYNEALGKYVGYVNTQGGAGGTVAAVYEISVASAIKKGDQIIIREKVVEDTQEQEKKETYYTYTFASDKGFYKFLSRVKDK